MFYNIVKDYSVHIIKIYNNAITTDNIIYIGDFSQLRLFPLLISTGNRKVDIMHHFCNGETNILTQKKLNPCPIAEIYNIGSPI